MEQTTRGRPILELERSGLELVLEVAGALVLVATFLTVALAWNQLPTRIPMHFNAAGQVNGWGPRESIWVAPGIVTVVFLALTLVARVPHSFNFPWPITPSNAEQQYRLARLLLSAVKLDLAVTCFLITSAIRNTALLGVPFNASVIPIALGGIPLILAVYFVAASRSR